MVFKHRATALFMFLLLGSVGTTGILPRVRRHSSKQVTKPKYSHKTTPVDKKTAPIQLMGEIAWDNPAEVAVEAMPTFEIAYGGDLYESDSNGLFEMAIDRQDSERLLNLSLVICKRTEPNFDKGITLVGTTIEKLGKCVWYDLEMQEKKKGTSSIYYWNIKEKTDLKPTDVITDTSLVVLMSPSLVVRVEDGGQAISGHTVLPRIVLCSSTSEQVAKAQRASTKSAIESIPLRRLTGNKKRRVQQKGNVTISAI